MSMARCDSCSRLIDTDDCPESCTDDGYLCERCAMEAEMEPSEELRGIAKGINTRKVPRDAGSIWWTICREECEFDVEVEYTMTPIIPAQTYGDPNDCYPAEGGEVEIYTVTAGNPGRPVDITEMERYELVDFIRERHEP